MKTLPLLLCALCVLCGASGAAEKPIIVFLLADDWAWNGTPVAMGEDMANSRMPVQEVAGRKTKIVWTGE